MTTAAVIAGSCRMQCQAECPPREIPRTRCVVRVCAVVGDGNK